MTREMTSLADIPSEAWPALIAAAASILGVLLSFFMTRKISLIDLEIKEYAAEAAQDMADIAKRQADLKERELKSAAAFRAADALLRRHEALRNKVRDLLTLLELHEKSEGPFSDAVKEKALSCCNSISLYVPPRGKFDEEINIQLGHIRHFFTHGGAYWKKYPNFFVVFQRNCWILVDSEFARIRETVRTGDLVERPQVEPWRTEFIAG